MAQWFDFEGRIVEIGQARSRKALQLFYLVEDVMTTVKYPVFVTAPRPRGRHGDEAGPLRFKVGDIVHVSGRMQKVIGVPVAGMKVLGRADIRSGEEGSGLISCTAALVPEEMELVGDTP